MTKRYLLVNRYLTTKGFKSPEIVSKKVLYQYLKTGDLKGKIIFEVKLIFKKYL